MVFERPKKISNPDQDKIQSNKSNSTDQAQKSQKKILPDPVRNNGNSGNAGNNKGGGNNNQEPSPWLDHPQHPNGKPNPHAIASFVEYLRWMRSPHPKDSPQARNEDPNTKVQILQLTEERANYVTRLTKLTNRTKLIAGDGNYFKVSCPWRIRVGGHRGPESILLPAFDALGMPYIPSSTLRGVARAEALRQLKDEKKVAEYFGDLDAKNCDRMGKVIFLDAYPLPTKEDKSGGLTVDMANNIWTWDNDSLKYSPNPNPFLSLQNPTFLIGIRSTVNCNEVKLKQIIAWLTAGLESGTGSQINSGYGNLIKGGESNLNVREFFRVEFSLEGQLIHGRQKFTQWQWDDRRSEYKMRGQAEAEVRPIAFKSMLRYWFRAFALGIIPATQVKEWEGKLFGSLDIKESSWVQVQILEGKVIQVEPRPNAQGRGDKTGKLSGILTLSHSTELSASQPKIVEQMFKSLVWLMFHLGSVGQGARKPLYNRQNAPWWRGSTLIVKSEDQFCKLPETVEEFQELFKIRLGKFSSTLKELNKSNRNIADQLSAISCNFWHETVDADCTILTIKSNHKEGDKPFSLSVLHDTFHTLIDLSEKLKKESKNEKDNQKESKRLFAESCLKFTEAKNLCGHTNNDRIKINGNFQERKAIPSPIWICNRENKYQVVTVFGANQDPRKAFVDKLMDQGAVQIFPFT